MTELMKQLVEEIEDLMPKYVYVVYVSDNIGPFNVFNMRSIHKTKKGAFKRLFGEERNGKLNKRYVIDRENDIIKMVVKEKISE